VPEKITERQAHWNKDFNLVQCESLGEFETYMGHEIAMQIKLAKDRNEKIAFISLSTCETKKSML
jgi:glucosamine-6-phosphate deaminase